jgi:ABC-2 type transport system permease protein
MNRAVFTKTARDAWLLSLGACAAVFALEAAIARMLVTAGETLDRWQPVLELPLVRNFVHLIMGADLLGDLSPTAMATFGMAHPLLWVLAWTLLIAIGTGVLAGEVDRGTADVLLTLPISRTSVYLSTSAVMLTLTVLISTAPLAGLFVFNRVFPLNAPVDFARLAPVSVNFLALNLAVGGLTLAVSSACSRRGKAVGIVLAILLISDLVNLMVQFWEAARPLRFFGFLHYYRPLPIVRSGRLPPGDLTALLALAVVTWVIGLWHFRWRDIPAA